MNFFLMNLKKFRLFILRYDFDYVLRLLESNDDDESNVEYEGENDGKGKKSSKNSKELKDLKKSLKYVRVKKPHEALPFKILKKIYPYDPAFRFTSRFWNTMMVGLVALYYVFLYWTYTVSMFASKWIALIPDKIDGNKVEVNLGDLLCRYLPDFCIDQLREFGVIKIPLGSKIVSFVPSLRSSALAVIIAPLFLSGVICLIQLFLLIRETKDHLVALYQGKCEFVKKASSLPKNSIASSSFHFGG